MIVINGDGQIFGRLASRVAKLLINGGQVFVVNVEKILITGSSYKKMVWKRENGSKNWGPFFPSRSRFIFKRAVRGMLPKRPEGRVMLARFRAYEGVPAALAKVEFMELETHDHVKEHKTVGEVAAMLAGVEKVSARMEGVVK